jgi:hypothetical protein
VCYAFCCCFVWTLRDSFIITLLALGGKQQLVFKNLFFFCWLSFKLDYLFCAIFQISVSCVAPKKNKFFQRQDSPFYFLPIIFFFYLIKMNIIESQQWCKSTLNFISFFFLKGGVVFSLVMNNDCRSSSFLCTNWMYTIKMGNIFTCT